MLEIISHLAFIPSMPFYDYTSSSSVIFLRFQEDVFWLTASGLEDLTEGRPLSIKSLPPRTHRHPTSTLRHSPPRSGDRGPQLLTLLCEGRPRLVMLKFQLQTPFEKQSAERGRRKTRWGASSSHLPLGSSRA